MEMLSWMKEGKVMMMKVVMMRISLRIKRLRKIRRLSVMQVTGRRLKSSAASCWRFVCLVQRTRLLVVTQ